MDIKAEIQNILESFSNPKEFAKDQFDALDILKEEIAASDKLFISSNNLPWIDAIIEGGYRDLNEVVAFEIKHVIEVYSLKYRISNFLYRLLESTSIRAAFIVVFDSLGHVEKVLYDEIIKDFEGLISLKIVDFEEFTGKKINRTLNAIIFDLLKPTGISFSIKEMGSGSR